MRRLPLSILAVMGVLAIAPALSATKPVDITQAGFTPNKVTVDFGDTVTWTNKDAGSHQVLADQMAFPTSPVLAANQTYSYTFQRSGSFGYRDALNTKRRGTVTVRQGVSLTAAPAAVAYRKATTLSRPGLDRRCRPDGDDRRHGVREDGFHEARLSLERSERRLVGSGNTRAQHRLRGALEGDEERAADREGHSGRSAEARPRGSFLGQRDSGAVVRRALRRAPALRSEPACVEDRQAGHASHCKGRRSADDDYLGRLPGSRPRGEPGSGCC